MKYFNYSIFTIAIAFTFSSCSEEKKEIIVPDIVQQSFEERFQGAADAEWEMEGENYEVDFINNENDYEVLFSPEGELLEVEVDLAIDMIPPQLMAYIKENYSNGEIAEAAKVMNGDGNFYKIDIESAVEETELWFDAEGAFVRSEIEGEDKDENNE